MSSSPFVLGIVLTAGLALCSCAADSPTEQQGTVESAGESAQASAEASATRPVPERAEVKPQPELPMPTGPGCYWLAPERGAARIAAVGGLPLALAVVGRVRGVLPSKVQVFYTPLIEGGAEQRVVPLGGQPLLQLPLVQTAQEDNVEAFLARAQLDDGLDAGAGTLRARFLSQAGELLCEAINEVRINAPPRIVLLRVDPAQPEAATNVQFTVETSDADDDELVTAHAWRHESGRAIHEQVLLGRETRPGERWTLEFSVQDPFEPAVVVKLPFEITLPVTQAARFCEPGTRLHGLGPPWDAETWCEQQAAGGKWRRHGFHRRWWSAARELIKSEEQWRAGRKHGRWMSWYENGNKSYEASWIEGQLSGPARAWHDNASRSAEYSFRDGEKDGLEVNWYREGGEQYRMEAFVMGRKDGLETRWYRNGNKQEETHWKAGRRHGEQSRWHPHGSIFEERNYSQGKRHGPWQRWHANGSHAAAGAHEHGRPSGEWLRWNENGELEDAEAVP